MKIISISGLDGSGKSTQIELLKKHLESQGKKVFYFHAIQFSLAQKIKILLSSKKETSSGAEDVLDAGVTKANCLQIFLRKIFLLIDIFRFKGFVKNADYDYILSDRYFYDGAINIKYLSGKNSPLFSERFITSPDLKIYLEAEPAIIMQRKRVPDQGIEYLRNKRDLFEANAEKYGLKKIDGNRNPEEVFEEIKSLL